MSTRVFVGNLNYRTTERQLTDALAGAGQVKHVHMGTDRETGRSRGFAFVEFATAEEAAEAIKKFDGQDIDGRKVRVNIADERPRPSAGGTPLRSPRPPYLGDGAGAGSFPPPSMDFRPDDFGGGRSFKNKGSRRGLRRRKRSLSF